MALYDHRSFTHGGKWWVAEVHGRSGGGWGPGPHAVTDDMVVFTCLTETNLPSRTAQIPAGKLNMMNHQAIERFLTIAQPISGRLDMAPYNTPDESEFPGAPIVVDDEQLRWIVTERLTDRNRPTEASTLSLMPFAWTTQRS